MPTPPTEADNAGDRPSLRLAEWFAGKRILFTGATGFVGKVTLSLLLDRYPGIGQVLVLARGGARGDAQERVFEQVLASEPFQPLRDRWGDATERFLRDHVTVVPGDVALPAFGIAALEALGRVDLVLHCAGLVTFDPSLQLALDVNTLGALHAAELASALGAPLVHVSTCFVAGARSGPVFENEAVLGEYPRRAENRGQLLDPSAEIADCRRLIERTRQIADDLTHSADFDRDARARLREEGRDDTDSRTLRIAVARERKLWLAGEQVRVGMERARHWGWPNTYTFTKALAEQVIVQTAERTGLRYAIARPSIVESALRFPFPGWNEGFTTSAPLAFIGLKGHRALPAGERNILDLIPVDLVAAGILATAGAALAGEPSQVFQLASGDLNPFYAARAVELVGLYRRRVFRRRQATGRLERFRDNLNSRIEMRPVSQAVYQLTSAPLFERVAVGSRKWLEQARPKWGAPRVAALFDQADQALADVERQAGQLGDLVELFLPFLWQHAYVFRCDHTRALYRRLSAGDRDLLPWDPERLDWRSYFLDVHMAGMETWVFPGLEEERDRGRRHTKAHRDLVELFYATTEAHAPRTAFRYRGEGEQRAVSYGSFRKLAQRCSLYLRERGVAPGDRVLLVCENRPEWPIAFFGILLAGAVAVPLDAESSAAEIGNQQRASGAKVGLVSRRVAQRFEARAGVFDLETVLAPTLSPMPPRLAVSPEDPASLIYTSGTTGRPKGVLLSHRNFAQLCHKLQNTFQLKVGDGVLSVLPLHHTFEFSCGLLTPLSAGAEITYLDELTTDRLSEALSAQRIHALVGVPALFQLLHRRLTQELGRQPRAVERTFELLVAGNRQLRDRLGINAGKLLFWPVHRRLGGHLRTLVSGGSSLSQEVHDAFRGLGFDLTEGYGLTEAAPVLTVTPPGETRSPGSVGHALPGVELRIEGDGQEGGVGEVLARGPNVMLGYFEDPSATAAAIEDGWLHTGDVGYLDASENLHLVGRKKELILAANGENVYPDELEERYLTGAPAALKELSVVGLPDGNGNEVVACLAVLASPDASGDEPQSRAERRAAVEAHFKGVSATLGFARRIKILHFWDSDLPRTASRKVKRQLVTEELQRLEALDRVTLAAEPGAPAHDLLLGWVRLVSKRPAAAVTNQSRLVQDLGFDSLAFTELSAALETAGFEVREDLSQAQTVAELAQLVRGERAAKTANTAEETTEAEISISPAVAAMGRSLLSVGQRALYHRFFHTKISGQAYIPQNQRFIVAANHASHLDMGLIKVAMGEQGELLQALAARDYFFDTRAKRAYFENFTRLIPINRHGSLKMSLRLAGQALERGSHLLIFPEGTRSEDGQLGEFKATLGFLALTHGVGILPVALVGTRAAFPKGSVLPKARDLGVAFGPLLAIEELRQVAAGLPKSEGYRAVTRLAEEAVRALLAGRSYPNA